MNKRAIDVVIVPPREIINLCIDINTRFTDDTYVRFADGYMPHITLAMGVIVDEDFEKFSSDIEEVVKNFKAVTLAILGFHADKPGWFDISRTPELQALHEDVSKVMIKYATRDAVSEMCYEPEKVAPDSGALHWMNVFDTEKSFENYEPHISICKGNPAPLPDVPIDFMADTIGIFQFGFHGTCKNELARFTLGL